MGFWQNVDNELKFLGKSRKELALEVGFDVSYISKGIERNGIPIADLALKIAKALGVSLEYLLGFNANPANGVGTGNSGTQNTDEVNTILHLYRKYYKIISFMETLPEEKKSFIEQTLDNYISLQKE